MQVEYAAAFVAAVLSNRQFLETPFCPENCHLFRFTPKAEELIDREPHTEFWLFPPLGLKFPVSTPARPWNLWPCRTTSVSQTEARRFDEMPRSSCPRCGMQIFRVLMTRHLMVDCVMQLSEAKHDCCIVFNGAPVAYWEQD